MRPRRPTIAFVVVALLLALLPVLAVFQYRWLGKVSEAERERLKTSLGSSAHQLGDDLDREISRAYMSLGIDVDTLEAKAWDRYADQFERWAATAPHANIVSDLFLAGGTEDGKPTLARLDRAARTFVPCDWDSRLAEIEKALAARLRTESVVKVQTISSGIKYTSKVAPPDAGAKIEIEPFNLPIRFGPMNYSVPALVIPVKQFAVEQFPIEPTARTAIFMKRLAADEMIVAVLDENVIVDEILPELVAKHFGADAGIEYDVGVRDAANPSRLVYSTNPSLDAAAFDTEEISEAFLSVSPDNLRMVSGIRVDPPTSGAVAVNQRFDHVEFKLPDGAVGGAVPNQIFVRTAGERLDEGGWIATVRHKAGSLDAAVEAGRLRNIALSFGIVLLLGVSVVLLVISSQRAQRLARRQMEFVAGVSHELRTPLAVICSAAENLAHGVVASERQVKQYGTLIEGEGRRLAELVEQVLEYAGAEAGKTRYSVRLVGVHELLDAAVRPSEAVVSDAGVRVEVAVAEGTPDVEGDPNALRRAVQNLIGNAVKYAALGGVVSISARPVVEAGKTYVHIAVADRGPGIDSDDLPHLFEPFYRGRAALDAQIHGSGLGLNLVKRVAEAHGGRVSVESALGSGSTFIIQLPAASAAPEPELVAGRPYEQAHPTG
jgi:two-component system, OmpR family, sensor histidine kinase SenX3